MRRIERNPLKVICSYCDFLKKTRSALLNLGFNLIPIDAWLFITGFLLIFFGFLYLSSPGFMPLAFWQVLALYGFGILFLPYTAYYLTSIFYRPVPFFYPKIWAQIPTNFTSRVIVFGKFNYSHQVRDIRDFFNHKTRTITKKVPFYWNHGQIKINGDQVTLNTVVEGTVSVADFQGVIQKHFNFSVAQTEINFGRASLFFESLPALRFTVENNIFYAVLVSDMNS